MVQRLVAKGADISNRDNPFISTPLGWADHNKQEDVVDWLRAHCAVDLHDAVVFRLSASMSRHGCARIPRPSTGASIIGTFRQSTPLHWAAAMGREDAARILLENGADPNVLAGNGITPLDVADANGAAGVAALLRAARRDTNSH